MDVLLESEPTLKDALLDVARKRFLTPLALSEDLHVDVKTAESVLVKLSSLNLVARVNSRSSVQAFRVTEAGYEQAERLRSGLGSKILGGLTKSLFGKP
jgi:Mn-dependent DtxR family transcriptional regulator